MIRQFEIGKAYHVMKIGDDTYRKIAFINYRIYNYGYYESRGSDINNLELANQFKRYLNGELKNNDE